MNKRQAIKAVRELSASTRRQVVRAIRAALLHGHEFPRSMSAACADSSAYQSRKRRAEIGRQELNRRIGRALRRYPAGTPGSDYGIELAHVYVQGGR